MSTRHPSLLQRPIGQAVWAVSWPMVLLGLLRSAYYLVDAYWVGRLGTAALAAMGSCAFAWWILIVVSDLAGSGVLSLIARAEGGGRRQDVSAHVAQAVWVAVGTTVILMALWPLRALYADAIGFESGSAEHTLACAFLGASLLAVGASAAQYLVAAVFRALGQTRTALVLTAAALIVNAVLDPVLIHGFGGLPGLGIAGAAWATALSHLVGAIIGVILLARAGIPIPLRMPELQAVRRIVRIGLPVTAAGVGFSLVYVVLGGLITDFGAHEIAALGVGHRIEGIAYLFCLGMSVGAATLVGQFLGAGQPALAARAANMAALQCCAAMVPLSVLFSTAGTWLMSSFTDDPVTSAAGGIYLCIQAPVFVFMGLDVVYEGAFTGAGHTQPPLWIGLTFTAARIPLAYALAHVIGLGIIGVWVAIAATTLIKGVLMLAWFRRMTWTGDV